MKKIILIMFILVFVVGCGKNKYITCSIDVNNTIDNYNLNGNYKIYYKNKYVTKIEKEEEYTSQTEAMIDYFYESKTLEYYDLNDKYNGFTYDIKKLDDKVKLKVSINLKEVDLSSAVQNKKLDKDYVKDNKLLFSGIKRIYESKGAVCK